MLLNISYVSKSQNKKKLNQYQKLMDNEGFNTQKLLKNIEEIIVKTLISAQSHISHQYKQCQPESYADDMCFEILGFDIMIDATLKPWLIEINHTPSFTTDTPFDKMIKGGVIEETLKIINCNYKNREKIINDIKRENKQRLLTGKRTVLSPKDKQDIKLAHQIARDAHEQSVLTNFKCIYPGTNPKQYQDFISFNTMKWESQTGENVRKKISSENKRIAEYQNKLVSHYKLSQINKDQLNQSVNTNQRRGGLSVDFSKSAVLTEKLKQYIQSLDLKPINEVQKSENNKSSNKSLKEKTEKQSKTIIFPKIDQRQQQNYDKSQLVYLNQSHFASKEDYYYEQIKDQINQKDNTMVEIKSLMSSYKISTKIGVPQSNYLIDKKIDLLNLF